MKTSCENYDRSDLWIEKPCMWKNLCVIILLYFIFIVSRNEDVSMSILFSVAMFKGICLPADHVPIAKIYRVRTKNTDQKKLCISTHFKQWDNFTCMHLTYIALHKKWSFPLRIFWVNVTKSVMLCFHLFFKVW